MVFCPRADLSLQTQHAPLYPLLSLHFHIFTQSFYHNVVLSSDIIFCFKLSFHSPFLLENPSAGSSFLASGPTNFFSSSLLVPALFFLLPFFLAQQHFLFYLSILQAPSFSLSTSLILPLIFAHSGIVSKSLHHTTLQSTQSTSLVSSTVRFPRVRRKRFSSC